MIQVIVYCDDWEVSIPLDTVYLSEYLSILIEDSDIESDEIIRVPSPNTSKAELNCTLHIINRLFQFTTDVNAFNDAVGPTSVQDVVPMIHAIRKEHNILTVLIKAVDETFSWFCVKNELLYGLQQYNSETSPINFFVSNGLFVKTIQDITHFTFKEFRRVITDCPPATHEQYDWIYSQWHSDFDPCDKNEQILAFAIKNNNLPFLKWYHHHFRNTSKVLYCNSFFTHACVLNHLEIAQWIYSLGHIKTLKCDRTHINMITETGEEYRHYTSDSNPEDYIVHIFYLLCVEYERKNPYRNVDTLKWLHSIGGMDGMSEYAKSYCRSIGMTSDYRELHDFLSSICE